MKTDILFCCGEFPVIGRDGGPEPCYYYNVARALMEETGLRILIISVGYDEQPLFEENNGMTVKRFEIPLDLFDKNGPYKSRYEAFSIPRNFNLLHSAFAQFAAGIASSIGNDVPVWCHGHETADAAVKMKRLGYPVVGVAHYLVADLLMRRLEIPDDPLRRIHSPTTMSYIAGMLCTKKLRPSFVRLLIRNAPIISRLPLPSALELLNRLVKEAVFMEAADIIVAVGPSFADSVVRYYPHAKSKLRYCTAGAPDQASQSNWPFPYRSDSLKLVMVARPDIEKGWDYAAAALKNIESKYPDKAKRLEFVAIGGLGEFGDAYAYRAYKDLNRLRKIPFANLGLLPHREVMKVMSGADVLLLPSQCESFGLAMVEAMANGCMILASDADGPRDVVKAPWGMLMNFQDPGKRVSEIERGILKLLSLSREEIRSRGEEARKAARAYTWKECALAHAAALEEARRLCS
jgi:glycosyltransferase involved in cell wall biosynthesis